jgi:hypothetical protein
MSRIGRIVTFIVLLTIGIVGWTLLQPVILAYEVKTVARISCNQVMREMRTGQFGTNQSLFAKEFERRVRAQTQLALNKDMYEFTIDGKDPRGDLYCNAKIVFPTVTPWFLISEVMTLAPYKTTKIVRIERQRGAAGF